MYSLYLIMAQGEVATKVNPSFVDYIFHSNVLNVLIVLAFLIWIFKKFNLLSGITSKQKAIYQRIKAAEESKEHAENELRNTEKSVQNLGAETDKIIKEANEVGDSLYKRIIKEAENEAEEILKRSRKSIEAEREMASLEVTKEISRTAFLVAEEHIKQAIDEKLHKKYIDEFLDNLPNIKV